MNHTKAQQKLRKALQFKRRLSEGRCPKHGAALCQSGLHYDRHNNVIGVEGACPRGGCGFFAARVGDQWRENFVYRLFLRTAVADNG